MKRFALIILATMFLLAAKCGPLPCDISQQVVTFFLYGKQGYLAQGDSSVTFTLLSGDSMIRHDSLRLDTLQENLHVWIHLSREDSITLPAKLIIKFIGKSHVGDSLFFDLTGSVTAYLHYREDFPDSVTQEMESDSSCSVHTCWVIENSTRENTCAEYSH